MSVERSRQAISVEALKGQLATGGARGFDGGRQLSTDGTSRMNREVQVRICEGLGVKFPGPTRRVARGRAGLRILEPMQFFDTTRIALAALILIPAAAIAQDETSRAVAGGGISIPGWTGKIDANEEKAGQTINNAKLTQKGKEID